MQRDASNASTSLEDASKSPIGGGTLVSRWIRRLIWLLAAWIFFVGLPSITLVRTTMMWPLYVHDGDAEGECAYVMAGGSPYYERLRAASDLFHWDRVERIYISDERDSSGYHFALKRSITRAEKARLLLRMWGVPDSAIQTIPVDESALLSSSGEAHSFAANVEAQGSIVVVTSAPHTRRSRLCFQRVLPAADIAVYSASEPAHSAELSSAIWLEYLKLALYYFLA